MYAPLGETPVAPDVVLFACKPSGAMLLSEAANRAGVGSGAPAFGMADVYGAAGFDADGGDIEFGVQWNCVYTGLGEDEMYFVVRGADLAAVAEALGVIADANAALQEYAEGRRSQLATI